MVNGHAIYCVAVKHSPGVGAASPDGQASENVRKNEPLNGRKNMLSGGVPDPTPHWI